MLIPISTFNLVYSFLTHWSQGANQFFLYKGQFFKNGEGGAGQIVLNFDLFFPFLDMFLKHSIKFEQAQGIEICCGKFELETRFIKVRYLKGPEILFELRRHLSFRGSSYGDSTV